MKSIPLILCSTSRLAHSLQLAHAHSQLIAGADRWQPLNALTLKQWLDDVLQDALLCGEIAANQLPQRVLNVMEERLLWERIIKKSLAKEVLKDLFDTSGMASAAMEAHALMQIWKIEASTLQASDQLTEETKQFLNWRDSFQNICLQENWLDAVRYTDLQISALTQCADRIAKNYEIIHFAGFDRMDPQQQRLFDALPAHGIQVERWQISADKGTEPVSMALPDQQAECRAAVAWAAEILNINPQARLAIVVPELAALHESLENLLDDVLHPATLLADQTELSRCNEFSLGQPLARQPLVAVALDLLQLCAGRWQITQEDFSRLFLNRYWSADITEADTRARFDAQLRRKLPQTLSLKRIINFAEHLDTVPKLVASLQKVILFLETQPKEALPSAWVPVLHQLLQTLGWPGERSLSSHEFQAQQAFFEVLTDMAKLDALLGTITLTNMVQYLQQCCLEQIFQVRTLGDPPLQILGLLESLGHPLDALWVMGMNDHIWPPPPRTNPLLPASIQRNARTPNADSQVQTEFAQAIHQRLIQSASQIIFSWAEKEADRVLSISPLIAGYPAVPATALAQTLAEQCLPEQGFQAQFLDDHLAPSVIVGEHVRGGTGLLKAQAICPAWAYYQYRLGARKLETPIDGLDPSARGNLVHLVLQVFWQGHDSYYLQGMSSEHRRATLEVAATQALKKFNAIHEQALPDHFMKLEHQRLVSLTDAWLQLELARPAPFTVEACEFKIDLTIEGLEVSLLIDRIDLLEDDSLVIIDYKTGAKPDFKNWADARITEPQLPIYAALALKDQQVAAVCFARVKTEEHAFSGIAKSADLLPKVHDLDNTYARKIFEENTFPNWDALLQHWQQSISAVAQEIKAGEAAIRFTDESDLKYCEVLTLLRLPERQLQLENLNNRSTQNDETA